MKTSLCVDLGDRFTGPQDMLYKSCAAHGALRRVYYMHAFWRNWHEAYDSDFMGYHGRYTRDRYVNKAYNYWFRHYNDKLEIARRRLDDQESRNT
jgi:hypothetical protein